MYLFFFLVYGIKKNVTVDHNVQIQIYNIELMYIIQREIRERTWFFSKGLKGWLSCLESLSYEMKDGSTGFFRL